MALPKLNQTPSYELTIPSTQEKIKFRPFLVKEQNDTVYSCELIQAFPTTLGQIQLGDGNTDGIVELTVQLSYKNWRSSANRGKPFGFNVSSLIGSSAAAGAISSTIKKFL